MMRQYNTSGLRQEEAKWCNLPTKPVRVPEAFAFEVLNYARQLDSGEPLVSEASPPAFDIEALIAEYLKENTRWGAMGEGRDFAHLKKFVEWLKLRGG